MFPSSRVVAVIITHNRQRLLACCLDALELQDRRPDLVIIVDNASDEPVDAILAHRRDTLLLRLSRNQGPAAAFGLGIRHALASLADFIWMMDDDGWPADPACLSSLLATSMREGADLVSPLIRDIDRPDRLAFPIRQGGRTKFTAASLDDDPLILDFAHLFNGALIARSVFQSVGLPNARLFIRGDEVEFLLRMRRAGLRILTDLRIGFLHPSSGREIHPILGGRFYAVVPNDPIKCFYQFRNRGWIFARYGMWGWLAADHVRYACWYLFAEHDPAGYGRWLRTTWMGVLGQLDAVDATLDATLLTVTDQEPAVATTLLDHAA